jgi:hypothetical protein
MTRINFIGAVLTAFLLMPCVATAERSVSFGQYTIHYNALPTGHLPAEVAREYKITRGKNRALMNISVLKKVMGTTAKPVKANISGTATNLSRQVRNIEIREIVETGAIYYIAELRIAHEETLRFALDVTPDGEAEPYVISFDQQFFTE